MKYIRKVPSIIYETSKFCPGCGHGIVVRLISELIEELELQDKTMLALSVGCSCHVNYMLGVDRLGCPHGRAAACAAGMKRMRPDHLVFTYQGDGDALSIGISETLYSAQRNEIITSIIINNGVYGMTGGQSSPTTLIGQKTATSGGGRTVEADGLPIDVIKLLSQFDTVSYLARGAVDTPVNINRTKHYLKKAFEKQLVGKGYSCVEILSPCPTNWHLSPLESLDRITYKVSTVYPLGEYIDRG